jgi:hypothetical protein
MRKSIALVTAAVTLMSATPAFAAKQINLQCMQQKVETRGTNLISAFDLYTNTLRPLKIALKDNLRVAWAITDKPSRNAAIKTAEKAYRDGDRAARKVLKDAERQIERTYKTEIKTCTTNV